MSKISIMLFTLLLLASTSCGASVSPEARKAFELGNELSSKGEYESAIKHYDEAIKHAPSFYDAHKAKALLTPQSDRFNEASVSEALKSIDFVLEREPKNELMLIIKQETLYITGRLDEALEVVDKLLVLKPEKDGYFFARSQVLYELGRVKESYEAIDKAIGTDPSTPNAGLYKSIKAGMLIEEGRYEEALAMAENTFQDTPEDPTDYLTKAKAFMAMGKYDEALKNYEILINKLTQPGYLYLDKGKCLLRLKKYDDAISCFDKMFKHPDFSGEAKNLTALALIGRSGKGDREKAEELLLDTIKKNPDDGIGAEALLIQGKREEAFAILKKEVKTNRFYKRDIGKNIVFEKYRDDPEYLELLK